MSRLSEKSGVLVIAQRLAPLDLIGRLRFNQKEEEARLEEMQKEILDLDSRVYLSEQEKEHLFFLKVEAEELDKSIDRWTIVEYPALATQDEYLTLDKKIVRVADPREIQPEWTQLRKVGDALQPERYSRSFLLKLKRANPNRFNAMYMLSPVAETGDFFTPEDFRYYDQGKHPKINNMHVYCAFDLAISTKATADYTVGIAGGVDHEGNLYLLEIVRGRFGDLDLTADLMIDLHTRWQATITGVEKSALELALNPVLQRKMADRKQFIMLADGKMALKPISDKKVRARTLQALAKQGKLHIPNIGGIWDEFVAELTNFPLGAHDDMVDAAAYVAIMQSRDGLPKNPEEGRKVKSTMSDIYSRLFKKFDEEAYSDNYMSS
jgi:predicted phage terminase large subunit-like protein